MAAKKQKKERAGTSITVYQRQQRLQYKKACEELGVKMGVVGDRFVRWFSNATVEDKWDFYRGLGKFFMEHK